MALVTIAQQLQRLHLAKSFLSFEFGSVSGFTRIKERTEKQMKWELSEAGAGYPYVYLRQGKLRYAVDDGLANCLFYEYDGNGVWYWPAKIRDMFHFDFCTPFSRSGQQDMRIIGTPSSTSLQRTRFET